ncbi:STAS domain-containing protein [Streptomyces sp. NPDC048507]|uniref:STAS domain-containing protein n=1 Tax=Streptomyces sp. NPDC048507 TaxID=3365560 RepID=UPI00371345B2
MAVPSVRVRSGADGELVLLCAGEFDMESAGLLSRAVMSGARNAQLLVVDVSELEFGDSSFLNVLLGLRRTHEVVLAGPVPSQFRRVLEITGADALFEVRDDGPPGGPAG